MPLSRNLKRGIFHLRPHLCGTEVRLQLPYAEDASKPAADVLAKKILLLA